VRIYPFFIPHGGCPHRCVFCHQGRTSGQDAPPSPGAVRACLEDLLPVRGGGEVAFYGGTFTLLPERVQRAYLDAVAPFLRQGRADGVRVSTRPDSLPDEAVTLLADGGVTTVEIGCQSFSSAVLQASGRGHDPGAARPAVERLRKLGMTVGVQLMPGLPGGDRAEARRSLDEAFALGPDFLRIYPTVVLRGSALESAFRAGSYRPLLLEEAVDWCAELWWRCRQAQVPVIRMGLQGTPELDGGAAWVAGPYHPAFGQLVRSRLWRRAFERWFRSGGAPQIEVNPADLADALGHRRGNFHYLEARFGPLAIKPRPDLLRESFASGGQTLSLMRLADY
jgi:histone acetyltransferase (RNA polymerase elongator complex component)